MNIKISKQNITSEELMIYNKPKRVYIPLISGNDTDITILVNKGEYVYKGSIIAKRKGDFRIPIHSSVSGTVLDFEEKTSFNGKKVKCVVIENDFNEKIEHKISLKKDINTYTKEEFIEILKDSGIIGLGGAGFPTYVKYEANKIKTLIINAVECEPYITSDYILMKLKCEEILETIDAILEINHIDEAIIAIKENNTVIKELFQNYIGTYLKIKLKFVDNYYPAGWERNLIKDLTQEKYNVLPIEKGIIVNNVSTIYAIHEALKYKKPLIERIVTFSGDNLKKPQNVFVKVGTPVIEVLKELGLKKNSNIISGGPMMGNLIDEDAVISSNQNCILAMNKEIVETTSCLKCGKCVEACPAKLSPVLIMKCVNKSLSKDKLKNMNPTKCIECGLCSFVCPAKIDVREQIKYAKKVLKGDK